MRPPIVFALVIVPAVVVSVVAISSRSPRNDRAWAADARVLVEAEDLPDGSIRLRGVRDWRYAGDSVVAMDYFDADYDPEDVASLWLYESPLDRLGLIAHTFLVFGFVGMPEERRWLAVSIEARKEADERYSIVGGMLRSFEVTHVWASERDVVTRRVDYYDAPLTRYRIEVPPEVLPVLFREFVAESRRLERSPRWYNTLRSNCTSLLARTVDHVYPGAIPWNVSYVLTGRADDYLAELGWLDAGSATRITREWMTDHPLR